MSDKQDRTGARTAADIERKYSFNKSFAEVMGIANDARKEAEKASEAVVKLDEKLDAEEVFNRLTENGKLQGIFKEGDKIYVNAEYLSGKYIYKTEVFLEPEKEEVETIRQHRLGIVTIPNELIPYYDSNNNGVIDMTDLANFNLASLGKISLANWSGAKKTTCTIEIDLSNPEKVIRISGKNMWGRTIERYIGINSSNIKNLEIKDYVADYGTNGIWTYEKWASGKAVCWGKYTASGVNVAENNYSGFYYSRGIDITLPFVFKSIDDYQANGGSADRVNFARPFGTSTTAVTFIICGHDETATSANITVYISVKGQWQ